MIPPPTPHHSPREEERKVHLGHKRILAFADLDAIINRYAKRWGRLGTYKTLCVSDLLGTLEV